jgi:hypothetical protein
MANTPRRRLAFVPVPVPGPWLLWPFALPVTPKQLELGAKLVRARGEFWSQAFDAVAEMADEWSKELRDDGDKD